MAIELGQGTGLVEGGQAQVSQRHRHRGGGSDDKVIEPQEEGIGEVLENSSHLSVVAASRPIGEDPCGGPQTHGIWVLGQTLIFDSEGVGEVELLPSSGLLEGVVGPGPLGWIAEHGDDPHRRVVTFQGSEATWHVEVRRSGIEENRSRPALGEELIEPLRIGSVLLDVGTVEEVGFLALGEADLRVRRHGRSQRGGAAALHADDGSVDRHGALVHARESATAGPRSSGLPIGSSVMTALSLHELATVVAGATPVQAVAEATRMAQAAEVAGLSRVWVAEHHGMPGVASAAPAVLAAHLAARTTTIRIGSGGVMLPNHAPLVVAEQFGTLEALHPGRIDLGIGRAPGTDLKTARALGRGNANQFPDDLVELIGYFTGASEQLAMPGRGPLPEIWLLGSSTYSAHLAGMLGLPFSFAYHFSPEPLEAALATYREQFRPSAVLEEPHVMLGVAVVCAPDDDEAAWLAGPSRLSTLFLRQGRPAQLPSPEEAAAFPYTPAETSLIDHACASHVVGSPERVAEGLAALADRTGADELMLGARLFDVADRERSVALTAAASGIRPRPVSVAASG